MYSLMTSLLFVSLLLAASDNKIETLEENKKLLEVLIGIITSVAIVFVLIVRLSHSKKSESVLTPPINIMEKLPIEQSDSQFQIFNPILSTKNTVGLDYKPYSYFQFNAIVYDTKNGKIYKVESLDFSLGGLKQQVKKLYNFNINSILN